MQHGLRQRETTTPTRDGHKGVRYRYSFDDGYRGIRRAPACLHRDQKVNGLARWGLLMKKSPDRGVRATRP